MPEEDEDDDRDDDDLLDQLPLQRLDRPLDEVGAVVGRDDPDAGRQLAGGKYRLVALVGALTGWWALFALAIAGAIVFYLLTMPKTVPASELPAHTPDVANGEYIFTNLPPGGL